MKIQIICEACGNNFEREKGEHNRNLKLGRRIFCSNSCQAKIANNGDKKGNENNLLKGSKTDEHSEFRFFLRKIKSRHKIKKFDETDITLEYLKELWEQQNGICPLTGWKIHLPLSTTEWENSYVTPNRASLDRIISKEPYKKGNVRFIAHIANMAKHTYSDEDVINFCLAVANNINK